MMRILCLALLIGWHGTGTTALVIPPAQEKPIRMREKSPQLSAARQGESTRRIFVQSLTSTLGALAIGFDLSPARAAPPIAVIAEELGYFPVQNKQGEVVYVAKRVARESSRQAISLAKKMSEQGIYMVGTYWCPHTSRQKELFGREAWSMIDYVECSPKGYGSNPQLCIQQKVDGYPTWIFPDGRQLAGERSLAILAKEIGYSNFREELENDVPSLVGADSCKLR